MTLFNTLSLIEPLLRSVREEGYDQPTPIQLATIPHVLQGRDVLGCAQTGTGKTAAFALPILQRLHERPTHGHRHVRVLVLSPTRELASQIGDDFGRYGRHTDLRATVVFGGVGHTPQADALRAGIDILVATPGRLMDFMRQRVARLDRVEILVLDEADRMLDMGFIHDVRKIVSSLPKQRQTLFFSATLPHDILALAQNILTDPVRVEVTPTASTVDKIRQSLYFTEPQDKFRLLVRILQDPAIRRMLVFTRTKRGAGKVSDMLNAGSISADALHGNKGQTAREQALEKFKKGACRVLVATDIASRGLDVEEITHVVNYDLPDVPENYVHRIGRTARAGAEGAAITFCSRDERAELHAVETLIRKRIPVKPTPERLPAAPAPQGQPKAHHAPRPVGGHPPSHRPGGRRPWRRR